MGKRTAAGVRYAGVRGASPIKRLATLALLGAIASGCASARSAPRARDLVEAPSSWQQAPVQAAAPSQWCSDFQSPELEGLLRQAQRESLTLAGAWARLSQAEAVARQAGASRYPTADLQASAGRARAFAPLVGAVEDNRFSLSAAAAYEIDIWGRLSATREATALEARAVRMDASALAISLTSELAEAWFDVAYNRQKIALLDSQIALGEELLELLGLRLAQGTATALDYSQQEQQIEGLRAQQVLLRAQETLAAQRLAVLAGQPPQEHEALVKASQLPALPAVPDAGVPSRLLERRPDLRAALLRLEAADARSAAAARERLPSLRLSASVFVQATELGKLFDEIFWTITGTVAQPLFDGGRRGAELDRAQSQAEERLYAFGQTYLQAMLEVQNALILEMRQAQYLDQARRQQDKANHSLDLSRARFSQGTVDYLRVLTALQSVQQVEHNLLDARRRQFSHRVQLCRALGGTWADALEPPSANKAGALSAKP